MHGYFGLSSLVNNPAQGFLKPLFSQTVNHQTNWSYWQDLALITQAPNAATSAPALWDNQGVQYGLNGLKQGSLSATEFLHLNYHIGGWKAQTEHHMHVSGKQTEQHMHVNGKAQTEQHMDIHVNGKHKQNNTCM